MAAHYDELMRAVPYDMWAGYYRLLLAQGGHDPDTVLDVCCGTGSVAELLADAGYEVTGIDLSPDMIAVAQAKEVFQPRGVTYLVADATNFDLGRTFDAAYSFFDSLNYITSHDGLRAALRRVAAHLKPGGTFIFDLNTEYAFTAELFTQEDKRKRSKLHYEWKGQYDKSTRLIHVDMRFWRDGEEFREVHVQRAHAMDEIIEGLRDAGFAHLRTYDSYTLDEPDAKSDRIHLVAVLGTEEA